MLFVIHIYSKDGGHGAAQAEIFYQHYLPARNSAIGDNVQRQL